MVRLLAVGAAAGYAATRAMDRVTTAFRERQSEESRRREQELQDELPTAVLARKVAGATGREIGDEQASNLGMWFHYGLGASGGILAALMLRGDRSAVAAGLTSGMLMWISVDEGMNYVLGLTPPATAYPLASHLRGLVGHLAYGVALGSLLVIGRRIWGGRVARLPVSS